MSSLGKSLILIGIVLIVVGGLITLLGGRLGWFGSLPGDIKIERGNFRFYAPITTMLIVSVILSLIFQLISRFFR